LPLEYALNNVWAGIGFHETYLGFGHVSAGLQCRSYKQLIVLC